MLNLRRSRTLQFEKLNIREFFETNRKLMVFLPEDKLEAYRVVEYLQSWFEDFAEIIYFAPSFQVNFLRKLKQKKLTNVSDIRMAKGQHENAVILYLYKAEQQVKYLQNSEKSLILALQNSQLQFSPAPGDIIEYLKQAAAILGRNYHTDTSELSLANLVISKNLLMQNKFPNIILHMIRIKDRGLKSLTLFLKSEFAANIHFTSNSVKMKDIPNIKILDGTDLLQLCIFADKGELLITDDPALHSLMNKIDIKSILIKDVKDLSNLKAEVNSRLKGRA